MKDSRLESKIAVLSIDGNNQFSDCFSNFLDLALSYFCNNMNERQMKLRKIVETHKPFRDAYKEAITCFGDDAADYHDPLGDIFMSRISHGDKGQFFTPEDISLFMSEIVTEYAAFDGMTINDCACGTGRMLLMALKHLRERKDVEPVLYANDLSMMCAKMTLLNFLVNSADGMVTCSDALIADPRKTDFFKIDKVRNLATGAVLSTYWQYNVSDVDEVQEKREKWWLWIAEHGWVKWFKISRHENENIVEKQEEKQEIAPLPTEIHIEENGQLKLFD